MEELEELIEGAEVKDAIKDDVADEENLNKEEKENELEEAAASGSEQEENGVEEMGKVHNEDREEEDEDLLEDSVKKVGDKEELIGKRESKGRKKEGKEEKENEAFEKLNENIQEVDVKEMDMEIKSGFVNQKENSVDLDEEFKDSNKILSHNITEGEILQQLGMFSKKNTLKFSENPDEEADSLRKSPNPPINRTKEKLLTKDAIKISDSFNSKPILHQQSTFEADFPITTDQRSQKNHLKSSLLDSNKNEKSKPAMNILAGIEKEFQSEESSPETPNLASPLKPIKNNTKEETKTKISDSAALASLQDEVLNLRQQLKESQKIIEKQAQEIFELKNPKNLWDEPKKKMSPKPSGFLQGRAASTFLQKNQEFAKSEDFDFWKIAEDTNSREPQKLEDISALKDLWILNTEAGAQVNYLGVKKPVGVKANALTKYGSNKSANIKKGFLPKISSKKDISK